jgi:hypothetical protein
VVAEISAFLHHFIAWYADLEPGKQALLIIALAVIAIPILLTLCLEIWKGLARFFRRRR